MKCMNFREECNKEIKNDEWREHKRSEEHLKRERGTFCSFCKTSYYTSKNSINLNEIRTNHQDSQRQSKKQPI